MTITLCPAHLRELEERWGSRDKIKESYGELIIDVERCEDLRCIRKTQFYCPHCHKPVKAGELLER